MTRVRPLTLNEELDDFGRFIQKLGTNVPLVAAAPSLGRAYTDSPTEAVNSGDIEVWEIANLTGDTHPIHFHLVNVQVLSRRAFDSSRQIITAPPPNWGRFIPPDPNERGWKETVKMNPGDVTTVAMTFDLPRANSKGVRPRLKAMGIPDGNEYVWHCHILEHEEHDMMRPLVVKGRNPLGFRIP